MSAAIDPGKLTQPLSANFRDVDFKEAINFLSESAGVNIVLSPKALELGKPVTLHLVQMPLQRALEYLVKTQGLVYRFDEEAISVATLDEMESEPLENKVFFLSQGPGLFASFEPIAESREGVAMEATAVHQLKTIKDILDEIIPEVSGSSMLLDGRTGALIVTHVPYYLQQIERLLHELDISPIEVRIEARFIELTLSNTNELGFDAQLTGDVAITKKSDRANVQTKAPGLQLSQLGSAFRRGTKVDFTDFPTQASGQGLNLTFQGILTGTQYQAVLHALAQTQKTKTLSAPQVTTLNNQTAAIKVVTEFVYASRYEPSVVRQDLNGDGKFDAVVNGVRETRFVNVPQDFVTKDLGILLNVTPSVGRDHKTVILALKPEVTEKKADDTFAGEVKLPRFTTRYLTTTIVVEDGQTVILGGLMKDTTTHTVTKVPVLGHIPILGPLFQKRNDAVERSNLLIFVTASVVDSQKTSQLARQASP
ncbi:MAG: hypothetical protein HYZ89_06250 [Candidatus Omnitrophica bacterium]|nr:hypothetical protein [Candidatus Omnitrophota bacterium]